MEPVLKSVSTCSCMGTRHKMLTSCVDCGRIICEQENTSLCPFCKSVLIPPMTSEEASLNGYNEAAIEAYKLKVTFVSIEVKFYNTSNHCFLV